MHARIPPRALASGACLLITLAAGCAGPTRPVVSVPEAAGTGAVSGILTSQPGFYPLEVGNLWFYAYEVTTRIVPLEPGAEYPVVTQTFISSREIMCPDQQNGTQYMVEQVARFGPTPSVLWVRYRQERTGLFEYDQTLGLPPPCIAAGTPRPTAAVPATGLVDRLKVESFLATRPAGEQSAWRAALARLDERVATLHAALGLYPGGSLLPGGPRPGELTRLRYPLERKARWVIRDDPGVHFDAEVVGHDVLSLEAGRLAGHRIRLESNLFGPQDRVQTWYGRTGYLQLVAHLEVDAVDNGGVRIGTALFDEREALTSYFLRSPRVLGPQPWSPGGTGPGRAPR